jgi:hypothetical protein
MEALFCRVGRRRYRRIEQERQRVPPAAPPGRDSEASTVMEEIRLDDGVTLQDLTNADDCTWKALFHLVSDAQIVWMADNVYLSTDHEDMNRGFRYVLGLEELPPTTTTTTTSTNSGSSCGSRSSRSNHPKGLYVFASSRLGLEARNDTAICEFLVGLLARSETVPRVCFRCVGWVFTAPMLEHFLAERQGHGGHVKEVTLDTLYLDEDHCRVLSTAESPDLKIKLSTCVLEESAVEAFTDCLQRSRGPTELYECRIEAHVLARALRGNTRVTRVIVDQRTPNAPGMAAMAEALSENLGLQVLDFYRQPFDDSSWATLCASLRAHPTLHRVDLAKTGGIGPAGHVMYMSDEQKIRRMKVMADMLRDNTKLRTIVFSPEECDEHVLRKQIRPRLVMNKHRRRFLAIQEVRDEELRRKVLGRIVGSFRKNTNLLWWLLSSNADIAFPIHGPGAISTATGTCCTRPSAAGVVGTAAATVTGKRKRA